MPKGTPETVMHLFFTRQFNPTTDPRHSIICKVWATAKVGTQKSIPSSFSFLLRATILKRLICFATYPGGPKKDCHFAKKTLPVILHYKQETKKLCVLIWTEDIQMMTVSK